MIYLFGFAAIPILYSIFNVYKNFSVIKKIPEASPIDEPLVSIMVPARNESHNIEACVRSLFQLNYKNREVLVLDDCSEDDTFAILQSLQKEYPSLKILRGTTKPEGWVGKQWACSNLVAQASGEYYLFIDADTKMYPKGLGAIMNYAIKTNGDLISCMPKQLTVSKAEKLIIPLLLFYTVISYFPFHLSFKRKIVDLSIAWGFFMLLKKEMYQKINGHVGVKSVIMEDVAIAKEVHKKKGSVLLVNGKNILECRMYRNKEELKTGFVRATIPHLAMSPVGYIVMATWSLFTHTIAPFIFIGGLFMNYPFTTMEVFVGAFLTIIPFIIRAGFSMKFDIDKSTILFIPIGNLYICFMAYQVVYKIISNSSVSWKGRNYSEFSN